jgi:hypothetical protein
MRTRATALLAIITILAVTLVTIALTLRPSPLLANAPPSEFLAERAFEQIRAIAAQPLPSGSAAYKAAREHVLSRSHREAEGG